MKTVLFVIFIFSFACCSELTSEEQRKLEDYLNSQIIDYFEPLSHPLLDSFFVGSFFKAYSQVKYHNDRTFQEIATYHDNNYQIINTFESLNLLIKPQVNIINEADVEAFSKAVQLLIYYHCGVKIIRKKDTWLVLLCDRNSVTRQGKQYTEYYGYEISTNNDGTIAAITSPKGIISVEE